ncbi:MAG: hypothetical protein KDA61_00685 [Planctomycetales bacterium]|nr:hypothetical protein [Planctomycetales bacterium]
MNDSADEDSEGTAALGVSHRYTASLRRLQTHSTLQWFLSAVIVHAFWEEKN